MNFVRACKQNVLIWTVNFVVAVVVVAGAALAQAVQHPQTGLAVTPPAGYVARPHTKSGFTAGIVVARQDDANSFCHVDFSALTQAAITSSTQDQLNEMLRKVDQKEAMKGSFETQTLEQIEHAGVFGAVFIGRFTKSPWPNHASLMVVYYTPRGRTTVSCFSLPATFTARRPEFMAVARAVTLPR